MVEINLSLPTVLKCGHIVSFEYVFSKIIIFLMTKIRAQRYSLQDIESREQLLLSRAIGSLKHIFIRN